VVSAARYGSLVRSLFYCPWEREDAMHRISASVLFIAFLIGVYTAGSSVMRAEQGAPRENGCVLCQSRLSTPAEMGNRFLEWRASRHAAAGVTCDKCHGGDAAAGDAAKAHAGIFPPSNASSRLHEMKAPETCGSCHRAVVSSFVESAHYRLLKASEAGASCTNCHGHMGSSAARAPFEGESLCTFCHNTVNGPLPQRPDIVKKAKSTLDMIARTNNMVLWINELLEQAAKKKLNVDAEREDSRLLKITLAEAKAGWHAFSPEGCAAKAGKSFDEAVGVKDRLSKKLGL
jgi:nitrate/TMAO reductase-like tetraheme cytochrome c subunit